MLALQAVSHARHLLADLADRFGAPALAVAHALIEPIRKPIQIGAIELAGGRRLLDPGAELPDAVLVAPLQPLGDEGDLFANGIDCGGAALLERLDAVID
jgi:hypothetical protein